MDKLICSAPRSPFFPGTLKGSIHSPVIGYWAWTPKVLAVLADQPFVLEAIAAHGDGNRTANLGWVIGGCEIHACQRDTVHVYRYMTDESVSKYPLPWRHLLPSSMLLIWTDTPLFLWTLICCVHWSIDSWNTPGGRWQPSSLLKSTSHFTRFLVGLGHYLAERIAPPPKTLAAMPRTIPLTTASGAIAGHTWRKPAAAARETRLIFSWKKKNLFFLVLDELFEIQDNWLDF